MGNQSVIEYLAAIYCRYQEANKSLKTKMLTEAQLVCNLSRKHIIRQLNGDIRAFTKIKASGRPKIYPLEELTPHIQYIWISMERVTPKRLKAGMTEDWIAYYVCEPHIKFWLYKISVSTLARVIKKNTRLTSNKRFIGHIACSLYEE